MTNGKERINNSIVADVNTVSLIHFRALEGEYVSTLQGVHSLGLSPDFPTVTPASIDGERFRDRQWSPNSIGYLPPNLELNAAVLQPSEVTYVRIPDRIFKAAAFESIEPGSVEPRWVPGWSEPIAVNLIAALRRAETQVDLAQWPLLTDAIGTSLAVLAMRHLGAKPKAKEPYPDGLPDCRIRRVTEYVEEHLAQPIRLEELAGVAGMSSFHFARSFRKAMGITPVRYLWKRRLERAKQLLRDTSTQLAIIAYDCGYSSQSHFATMFKRETGSTPLEYRAHYFFQQTTKLAKRAKLAVLAAVYGAAEWFAELYADEGIALA